jgi:hypothetical protein
MNAGAIFIRERKTFRFLNAAGYWASDFNEARIFEQVWEALDACAKQHVHGAEIVLRCGRECHDVVIDVA